MLNITGYADRVSVSPGETINFMVNCETPDYRADVVRITSGDSNPVGPGVKFAPIDTTVTGVHKGRKQAIHGGSFGIVPTHQALDHIGSLTALAFIAPTTPEKGRQGIVTRWDPASESGFALMLDDLGCLAFTIGEGKGKPVTVSSGKPLRKDTWYLVAGTYDASSGAIGLYQLPLSACPGVDDEAVAFSQAMRGSPLVKGKPLLFAALFDRFERNRVVPSAVYNGKIESPRLADRAMSRAEIENACLTTEGAMSAAHFVGAWDFSKDISETRLSDVSGNGLNGMVINMPARAVPGHNYTGEIHCWMAAPEQWGAIHFHDDDLYDAGWEVDFSLVIPDDLRSGVYAVRMQVPGQQQFIVFVVRPPRGKPTAKLVYLFPLASYLAYANEHFATNAALTELMLNRMTVLHPYQIFLNEHREYGHSLYDRHSDGSGVYYSSRLRPILNMQPLVESNFGARPANLWQFNADTHITDWLEEQGVEYDVVTDEDLHLEGYDLLKPYRVVMTSTHPEYDSAAMWDALHRFTQQGGRLMYVGGNGFYWRIAFHPSVPGIIEVRRAEGGSRAWIPPSGEYYHSFTGEYGGMWRRQGPRAPNVLCGVGFIAQGFDESTYYRRLADSDDPRAAFIFEGVGRDERIGDFGLTGGGAAGAEVDSYNIDLGSPRHALVVAKSAKLTEAYLYVVEEICFNFMGTTGDQCELVESDIVFFETIGGGAVFSVGSIAWCGALSHNSYKNNVARIMMNVLGRFLDEMPFRVPDGSIASNRKPVIPGRVE